MLRDLQVLPAEMRSSAVELAALEAGIKPVMRITAQKHRLSVLIDWIIARGLLVLVREQKLDSACFAQIAPSRRPSGSGRLFQLFVSRQRNNLLAVANALSSPTSYRDIGLSLGYPECCCEWAAFTDRLQVYDGVVRQTNLVAAALKRSMSLHAWCNCLARETPLIYQLPMAVISHFPCRFDCEASVEQGRRYLSCCDALTHGLSDFLMRMLRQTILWWSDVNWPIDFAAETPGLLLASTGADIAIGTSFVAMGDTLTPGGILPLEGVIQGATSNKIICGSATNLICLNFAEMGRPEILTWKS